MKTKYIDLIEQTFHFPQKEFRLNGDELCFHDIDLMELVHTYGTPLKFTYLPKIGDNIQRARAWFQEAMSKHGYNANYYYAYCTKSSHFSHVLHEALKYDIHLETSSAFDISIIEHLRKSGRVHDKTYIYCNGFKRGQYVENIARLINSGHRNCIPIIDNYDEMDLLTDTIKGNLQVGIRIASEEEPTFEFYTSRLGIGYKDILPFYRERIQANSRIQLKMLHFFINTGIRDTAYYWNELHKCLKVYVQLKQICPELDSLNIGGGFPIKNSLNFDFDYAYMIDEIIAQIKMYCQEAQVEVPHIVTEFGSFTVGESSGIIYEVLNQKQQNDREKWNMINSSFITTLPDSWAIKRRFILLPINRWYDNYERVLLGGLTCDSDDYYNSDEHVQAIYLPKYKEDQPLYIGFFHTGAYQENIGGYGGLQHCLIPHPKHIILSRDDQGNMTSRLFREQQTEQAFMNILGYSHDQGKKEEIKITHLSEGLIKSPAMAGSLKNGTR